MMWAGWFRLFWVLDWKVVLWTWALPLHWLSTGQLSANSELNLARPQSPRSCIWAELLRGRGSLGRETHALKDCSWRLRSQHCYRKLESSRRSTGKNKHRKKIKDPSKYKSAPFKQYFAFFLFCQLWLYILYCQWNLVIKEESLNWNACKIF